MIIPDALWVPSPKDQLAQFAPQSVVRELGISTALAENDIQLFTVPSDYVLALTWWEIRGATAGVTLVQVLGIQIRNDLQQVIGRIARIDFLSEGFAAAPLSFERYANCNLMLMPGQILAGTVTYSAGAVGNIMGFSMNGVLIPRGNWQLG